MKFQNYSIGNKLSLISLTLVILVVAITTVSFDSYNRIGLTFQNMKGNSVPDLISIFETKNDCRRSFASVQQFLATGDGNNISAFKRNLTDLELLLSRYGKSDKDNAAYKSDIKKVLLTYKTDIETAGNDIFAEYKKRENLIEELNQIDENLENIFHNKIETVEGKHNEELENAIIETKNIYAGTIALIAEENRVTDNPRKKKIQEQIEHAKTNLKAFSNITLPAEFGDIESAIQKLLENSAKITELTRRILTKSKLLQKYEADVINTVTTAIVYENKELYRRTESIADLVATSKIILLILSAIFTAFALSISSYFSKEIISSISSLVESTKIMAKGNLSHRTQKSSNDEIGLLADSFNKMAEELEKQTAWVDNLNEEMVERRKAEEMLKEANQQLAASNHELMTLTQKLEKANRELKDFVYIASHDLREPLRKITSFGSILKESLEDKLTGDDKENMKYMIDGADRMTKMIEGLLAYSRVGSKEVPFEEVDLNETVEQLKQLELSKLLEETNATLEVPEPLPKIQANATQIRQLLQNLVGNGIKYHTKDVKPHIIIRAKHIDNGEIRVEVQDNGIGIEEKYFEDIFKMFRRLHSRQEFEGAGIGLSICKKIVEKHNGKIGVESKPGQGSTFWFSLPAKNVVENEQLVSIAQG
jgi:signal transduction histidine kinase